MNAHIPLTKCCVAGAEADNVQQVINCGFIDGGGPFTHACERYLESELGVPRALLTTSCTDALELIAVLLGIQLGDEVIVPSFTFVSTANAFFLFGARPVFSDIRPDTLNVDESKLEGLLNEHTKAVVPVHYAGVACDMDGILSVTERHGIHVVEDNAHGLFGRYKGKWLGTFGQLAAVSFDKAKNFTCGEGGAIIINDPDLIPRAENVRDKGTNRAAFLRGEVSEYTWVDAGSNHFPSELQAAFLYGQLMCRERIQARRRAIWHYYDQELRQWAMANNVSQPSIPQCCEQSFHQYHLIMPTRNGRDALIGHLKAQGITGAFHYIPLHLSDVGRKLGYGPGDCPVAEAVGERIVRLPFYNDLSECDLERIVASVASNKP